MEVKLFTYTIRTKIPNLNQLNYRRVAVESDQLAPRKQSLLGGGRPVNKNGVLENAVCWLLCSVGNEQTQRRIENLEE